MEDNRGGVKYQSQRIGSITEGKQDFKGGDARFYNNMFVGAGAGLDVYNPGGVPTLADGNVYFGKPRNVRNPTAGPFENPGSGKLMLKVW